MWSEVARRIVEGVGVKQGELVQVRDRAGRYHISQEVLLAVELYGATPLPEMIPPEYTRRMISRASPEYLSRWDIHRQTWMEKTNRLIVLQGGEMDTSDIEPSKLEAWRASAHRITVTEERIGPLPFMMVAIPTEERARRLGTPLKELEARVLPALLAGPDELGERISHTLSATRDARSMLLRSGESGRRELRLALSDRTWIPDDGFIDEGDIRRGGVVSNLPAGSIYTTLLEGATEGEVHLPRAGPATDVLLRFERGRVVHISAASGAGDLEAMFDAHSGEPRRIGHIGIGLNPHLTAPVGWTLVDAHVSGHVFVSFGENGYMGGENASSLNVDFVVPEATLEVSGQEIVNSGSLVV